MQPYFCNRGCQAEVDDDQLVGE
eukprot:SAG22_NODE_15316_length_351_cov_1.595238_1_plen_22_part_10